MYVKPLVKIIFLYIKFFISVVKIIKWNNIFLSHYVTYIRLKRILHVQISTLHRKIPWRLETKIDSFGIYIYDVQIPLCQNMFEWWVILSCTHLRTSYCHDRWFLTRLANQMIFWLFFLSANYLYLMQWASADIYPKI